MDLSSFMKRNLNVLEHSPTGLYAATTIAPVLQTEELEPGVIFCLKHIGKPIHEEEGYSLAPYYLTYVTDEGEVKYSFTQSKKILDILKKQGLGNNVPDSEAIERMNAVTRNGKDMSHYRNLLEYAVNSIIGKSEEKGVESLFSRGGTNLTKDSFQGMKDFEVISYMIVNR
jgi:hypothetical protein